MRFLYRNGFILETCHICMDSLIIYLHGNVNNSKFIKKIPLNLDQHPPLNFTIIIDYCNSLFYSIDAIKFQYVQNCLLRVVSQFPCFSNSEPRFKSVHRLFRYRIIF